VIRSESNTPLGRGTYEDSEKARRLLLENPGKQLANAAGHFIHYPHRHASVSPHLTRRRLLQQMFNGAWLDFYCIEPFHAQEDRLGLDQVREIYRFHAAHEQWLADRHASEADGGKERADESSRGRIPLGRCARTFAVTIARYLDDAAAAGFNVIQLMSVNAWASQKPGCPLRCDVDTLDQSRSGSRTWPVFA
jgi:hypothetical protein